MMPPLRHCLAALACALLVFSPTASAQSGIPADSFDLVLVGDSLDPAVHRVALKTNPSAGEAWTLLDDVRCADTERLLVLPDRSTRRYVGQDIRENYVALQITSTAAGGTLRAAYAVPSVDSMDAATCTRLARLVQNRPMTVRRRSLAVYERPRPASLRPDTSFIDHVETPVRHRKPGVMEVEWLEILFRPTE
jgi:hypothetical protein